MIIYHAVQIYHNTQLTWNPDPLYPSAHTKVLKVQGPALVLNRTHATETDILRRRCEF